MPDEQPQEKQEKPKKIKPRSQNLVPGLVHWVRNAKGEVAYLIHNSGVLEMHDLLKCRMKVYYIKNTPTTRQNY